MLHAHAGTSPRDLAQEMENLSIFVGDRPRIEEQDMVNEGGARKAGEYEDTKKLLMLRWRFAKSEKKGYLRGRAQR